MLNDGATENEGHLYNDNYDYTSNINLVMKVEDTERHSF